MADDVTAANLPVEFRDAVGHLRAARPRPEVTLAEASAPQRLAPYAVALTADIYDAGSDDELATGRLVVLYDPEPQDEWGGSMRIVAYVRADLEPEMAADPFLGGVVWTWLTEALAGRGAEYAFASGTVTRVTSESFGTLGDRASSAQVELRASWTPTCGRLDRHAEAWTDLMCSAGGLPPLPPGVAALPGRRR